MGFECLPEFQGHKHVRCSDRRAARSAVRALWVIVYLRQHRRRLPLAALLGEKRGTGFLKGLPLGLRP